MASSGSTKTERRRSFLDARARRTPADVELARAAIVEVVLARWSPTWTTVAAYVPLRTEPGSVELLSALRSRGAGVIVPVMLPDRDLDWREWPDGAAPLGPEGVAAASVVLVPALAVDGHGRRLGRGGGSYDRALRRVPTGVPVVALLYDGEVVDAELPHDPWDQPVSAVVTPSGWRSVGRRLDGE